MTITGVANLAVEVADRRRRIAFVAAPGGIRLELMEQLEPSEELAR